MTALTLDALNAASAAAFAEALEGLFDRQPWVAEAAARGRPYADLKALFDSLERAVRAADRGRRLGLLRQHPVLGRARAAAATGIADAEHEGAGLDDLAAAERDAFARGNALYTEKFGFPFVLCVRRHGRESIRATFERRLAGASAEDELATAIGEALRIAALRLAALTADAGALGLDGRLSTHVLDTARGRPAAGVPLELFEIDGDAARLVARAVTNADGRTDAPLIAGRPIPIARYELRFVVGAYFAAAGLAGPDAPFLDVIPVRFGVADPEGRYHVPLTVTPWAYATYRGS